MAEGKGMNHCAIPLDFENRMNVLLGEERWKSLSLALEEVPTSSVQINPNKMTGLFEAETLVPWYAHGRLLSERPSFTLDPLYHAGVYYAQESSSMFIAHVVEQIQWPNSHGIRALDLCAAPGGKSLLLSHFLQDRGVLFCNEINKQRNAVLLENMTKSGATNYLVANGSAEAWGSVEQYFDLIVVDAPCSGEGMFRKDMQARKEWSNANVQLCANRQRQILSDVLPALKPGGYLVYSTCTFAPDENEMILRFLQQEFEMDSVDIEVPQHWGIERVEADAMVGFRFWPDQIPGEGLFMAVLRAPNKPVSAHRNKPKSFFALADKRQIPVLQSLVDLPEALVDARGVLYHCPVALDEINLWAKHVYFTSPGVALGEIKQSDFVPHAALALNAFWQLNVQRMDVDLENALRYLRGDTPNLEHAHGLALLTYAGFALGWVKCMGHRCNNYYPKEWRIRMR